MSKIVIALGGNALGETALEQKKLIGEAVKSLADLVEEGHQIIISHGNGPQVGTIVAAFDELAKEQKNENLKMPLAEATAMSQGYIGFHLQNALAKELSRRGISKQVVSLVSQVVVSENDPALRNPTKPIGQFYTKEQAAQLEEKGVTMVEDSGRGYRQVVPSPMPVSVLEAETLKVLIASGVIPIVSGGGGIPVVTTGEGYESLAAVIDKDFSSEKVAELIDADYFIILTAVEKVALNYGTPEELWLDEVSVTQMKKYVTENHFAPGSMLPKVEAAITFVESAAKRHALITSLEKVKAGINGETGTMIVSKK